MAVVSSFGTRAGVPCGVEELSDESSHALRGSGGLSVLGWPGRWLSPKLNCARWSTC